MSSVSGAAGHAALAICESMLLSFTESKIIDEAEERAILEDAASEAVTDPVLPRRPLERKEPAE